MRRTNEPGMNITNQINAGLNDVRATLVKLSEVPETEPDKHAQLMQRARYELDLTMQMVYEHQWGWRSQPWSDRKPQVDEEFS